MPLRDHRTILPHANDSVVSAIRHVEIGLDIQSGVRSPVEIAGLHRHRRQINRTIQFRWLKAGQAGNVKDNAIVGESDGRNGVCSGLTDVQYA